MAFDKIITGGTVVTPDGTIEADVAIDGEKIVAVAESLFDRADGADIIEARVATQLSNVRRTADSRGHFIDDVEFRGSKVGEAVNDRKKVEAAANDLTLIAGQKAVITKARKSIATFKVRDGQPINQFQGLLPEEVCLDHPVPNLALPQCIKELAFWRDASTRKPSPGDRPSL